MWVFRCHCHITYDQGGSKVTFVLFRLWILVKRALATQVRSLVANAFLKGLQFSPLYCIMRLHAPSPSYTSHPPFIALNTRLRLVHLPSTEKIRASVTSTVIDTFLFLQCISGKCRLNSKANFLLLHVFSLVAMSDTFFEDLSDLQRVSCIHVLERVIFNRE